MNDSTAFGTRTFAAIQAAHPIHGLVAIANGPDYCLCGNVWPCRPAGNPPAPSR